MFVCWKRSPVRSLRIWRNWDCLFLSASPAKCIPKENVFPPKSHRNKTWIFIGLNGRITSIGEESFAFRIILLFVDTVQRNAIFTLPNLQAFDIFFILLSFRCVGDESLATWAQVRSLATGQGRSALFWRMVYFEIQRPGNQSSAFHLLSRWLLARLILWPQRSSS
jgi:hypothetical protein